MVRFISYHFFPFLFFFSLFVSCVSDFWYVWLDCVVNTNYSRYRFPLVILKQFVNLNLWSFFCFIALIRQQFLVVTSYEFFVEWNRKNLTTKMEQDGCSCLSLVNIWWKHFSRTLPWCCCLVFTLITSLR